MGCAATHKEPTNPDTEPPPPEEVLGVPPSDTAQASNEPAQEDNEEPRSARTTPEDFQNALQVVIQDDALLAELKLEEPGRFPLKIAGPDIPGGALVQANAKQVEIVTTPEDPKKEPVLVFTEISMQGDEGTFKYRYPIEGVRGTSYVKRTEDGRWVLESSRVSQY